MARSRSATRSRKSGPPAAPRRGTAPRKRGRRRVARPSAQNGPFQDPAQAETLLDRLEADPLPRRRFHRIRPRLLRTCSQSPDPDRVLLNFEKLVSALPNANMFYHYLEAAPDRLELLARIFAHSQALSDTMARNAKFFHFLIAPDTLEKPREKSWLMAELARQLLAIRTPAHKYNVVRRFRRRETLRIGARDLIGRATLEETTLELSNLADVCLQAVYEIALGTVRRQYKLLTGPDDGTGRLAIVGLGKLGGQELNYSSDVDVVFVYAEDGELTPALTLHQFYTRLAEEISRAVGSPSPEGNIYRIDLRLRPQGASGPLVQPLEGYENYYAQWGETWERMALIKARPVAGNSGVGNEFLETVQPFVYARHIGPGIIQQMAGLKERIEKEIVRDERLTRHVKLGIGGIREIEFIVQCHQMLRAPRIAALRERNTLRALQLLTQTRTLTAEECRRLADAYRFLRTVEHRLQMEMELQTHTIPDEESALRRLALGLGFPDTEAFLAAQQRHTAAVRHIFQTMIDQAVAEEPSLPVHLLDPERLPRVLEETGFTDVPAAVQRVESLLHGPGFGHVAHRTKDLFARLFPTILSISHEVADPDAALLRFAKFVGAYGSRGLLYEILAGNPRLTEMLVRLADASRFLADTIVQFPELFDEICAGASLTEPKGRQRMAEELRTASADAEEPREAARLWKRAELLRIGIEDVMGLVDLEQVHQEMTWLAEACLQFALEQVNGDGERDSMPLTIIGLGKFGGLELGYGADLDVLFVSADEADPAEVIRMATGIIEFMAKPTAGGMLFPVDPRLRPDGEKGPLASSIEAHERYYSKRALLWERQALLKARLVAGDPALGERFLGMIRQVVYGRALTDEEYGEIGRMRERIEKERGDPLHPELEFKTGPGGLIDVEFAVQALQLRHGCAHPQLRTAHTLAALNRLTVLGIVEDQSSYHLRRHYLFLRRVESALRRQENTSVSRLPAEATEQGRLAKRLGFSSASEFLDTCRRGCQQTRQIYEQLMALRPRSERL